MPMVHYAWIVAITGTLIVFSSIGLARFAFGMVLPSMASDLLLDYREQGVLSASYFLGYFAVVSLLYWKVRGVGSRALCIGGLAVIAVGLLAISIIRNYLVILVSNFAVGVGSGAAFIGAMAVVSVWFQSSHRGRAGGLVVSGAGMGILFSGYFVPQASSMLSMANWQVVWLVFAIITLAVWVLSALLLRDSPATLGLDAYGLPEKTSPKPEQGVARRNQLDKRRVLLQLGVIYAIFGATGPTYTTFIVTTMQNEFGVSEVNAGMMWAAIGGLSILSGGIFGYVSDLFGHRAGMFCALLFQAIAFGLVGFGSGMGALYASCTLFGVSVFSMPAILAAAVGDYLGLEAAAAGFAGLTVMFAIGQVIGPFGAGYLADMTNTFKVSFVLAMLMNLVAALICLTLHPPPTGEERAS